MIYTVSKYIFVDLEVLKLESIDSFWTDPGLAAERGRLLAENVPVEGGMWIVMPIETNVAVPIENLL